jgi:hypothetical protein
MFQWRAAPAVHCPSSRRQEGEAADHALAALVIAVEHVDRERLATLDRVSRRRELRRVGIRKAPCQKPTSSAGT